MGGSFGPVSAPIEVPYVTRHAPNAMVCSIDHLASGAGIAALRAGGNAADAAIATSAVLAVTSQHMCGMGGDLWALVHHADGQPPDALNSSGRAGSGADPQRLRDEGHTEMPFRGDARSIPVPGCVDGWLALHRRHGRLPFGDVVASAIGLARDGFPIGPQCAAATHQLQGLPNTEDYLSAGPPRTGQRIRREGVARALGAIVAGGRDAHYLGEFGRALLQFGDGEYTEDDLAFDNAEWVEPIAVEAWGHRMWTVPPNSQGYLTLAASWIASRLDLPSDSSDPAFSHLLIEAAKQAGYDRPDALHEGADGHTLVSEARLGPRAAAIDRTTTSRLGLNTSDGDTIYLATADADGMGVSLIQSNASGWGANVLLPGTRISLHNRGLGFNVIEGHPAEYGPRRRPPHTLAPALVQRLDGSLRYVLGTMGGDTQPQILLQLLARLLHTGESPGRALAAGRWRLAGASATGFHTWTDPDEIVVELEGHADGLDSELADLGHRVSRVGRHSSAFGHAHLIEVGEESLGGASDPRALTGGVAGY